MNSIKIVDCLPEKYTRSDKFRMKYQLNVAIVKVCKSLGESYAQIGDQAKKDAEKFANAVYNAKKFLEEQDSEKGRSARRRRDKDEWNTR